MRRSSDHKARVHRCFDRRPPCRAICRCGAEVRKESSRGHPWHRPTSEPSGPGEISRDKSVLAVDEGARLVDGQNMAVERRFGESVDQLHRSAADLVGLKVDVLFASGEALAKILQQETKTIPIVVARADNDLVTRITSSRRDCLRRGDATWRPGRSPSAGTDRRQRRACRSTLPECVIRSAAPVRPGPLWPGATTARSFLTKGEAEEGPWQALLSEAPPKLKQPPRTGAESRVRPPFVWRRNEESALTKGAGSGVIARIVEMASATYRLSRCPEFSKPTATPVRLAPRMSGALPLRPGAGRRRAAHYSQEQGSHARDTIPHRRSPDRKLVGHPLT
jgi:hypothetical protein